MIRKTAALPAPYPIWLIRPPSAQATLVFCPSFARVRTPQGPAQTAAAMIQLNDTDLQEAATAIRRGMDVYIHRAHGRMLIADDPERNVRADPEVFEAIMQDVSTDPDAYIHIERMSAAEAIKIMAAFTDRVRNQELWQALSYALKRPSPFQNFKAELGRFPKNYEKWRSFRQQRYSTYVREQLAAGQQEEQDV